MILKKNNYNIVLLLYDMLYNNDVEFISELVHFSKKYFKATSEHKIYFLDSLKYVMSNDKILVYKIDSSNNRIIKKTYNSENCKELIELIDNQWVKFNDHNETKLWYSYEIGYTKSWKIELKRIEKL